VARSLLLAYSFSDSGVVSLSLPSALCSRPAVLRISYQVVKSICSLVSRSVRLSYDGGTPYTHTNEQFEDRSVSHDREFYRALSSLDVLASAEALA
jgi:hypothetical protein